MFLDLPGHSDAINRHISASSVDWWYQTGLGGPGTYLTQFIFKIFGEISLELGMFLDLPGQSDGTNQQISMRSVDW